MTPLTQEFTGSHYTRIILQPLTITIWKLNGVVKLGPVEIVPMSGGTSSWQRRVTGTVIVLIVVVVIVVGDDTIVGTTTGCVSTLKAVTGGTSPHRLRGWPTIKGSGLKHILCILNIIIDQSLRLSFHKTAM